MKYKGIQYSFEAKNGEKVIIRYVRWEDLNDLIDLRNSLADEDGEIIYSLGIVKKVRKEDYVEQFSRIMANIELGREIRLVAEVKGKVIGYATVKRDDDGLRHRGWLGIAIKKEFRGLGIGTELMRRIIDEARKLDFKLILLETSSLNDRAIHVYRKIGFKEVGRISMGMRINDKYVDTIIMALQL